MTIDSIQSDRSPDELQARIVRLLVRAVEASGKSTSEIARVAGMKRDSLRRSLTGRRDVTLGEALAILEASGLAGEQTLLFVLLVDEEFAFARSGSGVARFLGALFRQAPLEIVAQLGDNADELRPRWAIGTAKLLARTLTQHIADLNRRGDAIGDRFAAAPQ